MDSINQHLSNVPDPHGWLGTLLIALILGCFALVVHFIGAIVIRRFSANRVFLSELIQRIHQPARLALVLFALEFAWRLAPDDLHGIEIVRRINTIALIGSLTWLVVAWIHAIGQTVIKLHPALDSVQARRVVTQTRVLTRSVVFMVVLLGLSFALMTIPGVRQLGTSLLASAGIAGVVAGVAARPVLGNFIAGLQLAFSQPLRIDDVLIVQNEWGRVEEITGTYVVMALWDERRLIIPLQWFIENPFQNWTRNSSTLLGSVFLNVDYRTPLEPLRAELEKTCRNDKDWDGRVCVLQVTDTTERSMQLRFLVSAADSSKGWDLRCRVREAMIDYMQRELPHCLPVLRVDTPSLTSTDDKTSLVDAPRHTSTQPNKA